MMMVLATTLVAELAVQVFWVVVAEVAMALQHRRLELMALVVVVGITAELAIVRHLTVVLVPLLLRSTRNESTDF